ncbi:MAG: hypothetical protein QXZ36_03665 [Thermoproteota archaeon]
MGKFLDASLQVLGGIGVLIGIYLVATQWQGLNAILNTVLSGLTAETAVLQGRGSVKGGLTAIGNPVNITGNINI